MADFLAAYSVQRWLESVPQGYLMGHEFGHLPGEAEPVALLEEGPLREAALYTTALLARVTCVELEAASALLSLAPDDPTRCFLATQVLDDARHVEIFTQRLRALGLDRGQAESAVNASASPALARFAELLRERARHRDFAGGLLGGTLILSSFLVHALEDLARAGETTNPKLAHMLDGVLADARRHLEFGEVRLELLLREAPRRRAALGRLQAEFSKTLAAAMQEALAGHCDPKGPANGKAAEPSDSAAFEDSLLHAIERELQTRLVRLRLA